MQEKIKFGGFIGTGKILCVILVFQKGVRRTAAELQTDYRTRAIIIPWAFIFSSHFPGGASIRERALFERGLYFFNRRTQLHDRIFFTMTCWWKDDAPIYR